MHINRRILSNTLLIGLIIAIIGLLYFLYLRINDTKYKAIDAIPQSSSLFIKFNSIDEIHKDLSNNIIWNDFLKLSDLSEFSNQMLLFDSILHLNSRNKKLITNQEAIISMHTIEDKINLLLSINLKNKLNKKFLNSLLNDVFGETFTILRTTLGSYSVNKLVFNQYEKPFIYVIRGGIFLGSWSEELLLESLKQLDSNQHFKEDASFKEVEKIAGKKVKANIFVNYMQLPNLLNALSNEKYSLQDNDSLKKDDVVDLQIFAELADWTELDLIIKDDKFLMSGYTNAHDSSLSYFHFFRNQEPQAFAMAEIIPQNATLIQKIGLGDFKTYFSNHQQFLNNLSDVSTNAKRLNQINSLFGGALQNSFIAHIENEFALVSTATNSQNYEANSFAIIKIKNQTDLKQYLSRVSGRINGSGLVKNYHSYKLNRINTKGAIPLIFGPSFQIINEFYYTFIHDYLLVANSTTAIEKYINVYESGRTMNLNPEFISFSNNMAERSNYYFYYNPRLGLNLLEKFTNKNVFKFILKHASAFKNYKAIGLQYSSHAQGLFTNFYINYGTNIKLENNSIWDAAADYEIVNMPELLKNHQNNYHYTSISDAGNQLYLFNQKGELLWKYSTDGPLLSKIYEVDYYKNGKIQYLFNTKNSIYLVDITGKNVANYPHKISIEATNGVSIFDYSNDKNYRIVFAGADQKIYNYDIHCQEVKGWSKTQITHPVKGNIQHLVANNRDYILLGDENGNTRILNRRGKDRILLKNQFTKSENSAFYVNTTNSNGLFITTNNTGKLSYISSSGNISLSDFGDFSSDHFFKYADFDNDGHKDFIYLDKNILKVFNRFKAEILHHEFSNVVTKAPILYKGPEGMCIIGIHSPAEQKVYLFDQNGLIETPQEMDKISTFLVGDILNNGSINLLVSTEEILHNYSIK